MLDIDQPYRHFCFLGVSWPAVCCWGSSDSEWFRVIVLIGFVYQIDTSFKKNEATKCPNFVTGGVHIYLFAGGSSSFRRSRIGHGGKTSSSNRW